MIEVIAACGLAWGGIVTGLVIPNSTYKGAWDRVTKAKFRKDRINLQIMLDHLRSFPEEWAINRDGASFPKDSRAKQIYIQRADDGWTYTLSQFTSRAQPLNGHFGKQFIDLITQINADTEKAALMKQFYPKLSGTLMLK